MKRPASELLGELLEETRACYGRFFEKVQWEYRCLGWTHYVVSFLHYSQGCGRSYSSVDLAFVKDYLSAMFERYPRRSTRSHLCVALKKWFRFLFFQERSLLQPLHQQLDLPYCGEVKLRGALSLAQVKEILDAPDLETAYGVRTKAIWELAYSCGLRASELASLVTSDLDFASATVTVRTSKNRSGRVLPVPAGCLAWLLHYLEVARPKLIGPWSRDELFLTSTGKPFKAGKLLKSMQTHHRYTIRFPYCLHQMRHSCATHLLDAGVAVGVIRQFLGHASLTSTSIYAHCRQSWLQAVFVSSHPRG